MTTLVFNDRHRATVEYLVQIEEEPISGSSDAFVCQRVIIGSGIMVCRLFGAKPLHEPYKLTGLTETEVSEILNKLHFFN